MIRIESDALAVVVLPEVGGTIAQVTHRATGLSVLGTVPWTPALSPLPGGAARTEAEWLTRYTGGWPLLFPNGGDACTVEGVFHGFHGEASVVAWEAEAGADRIRLSKRFATVPAEMERELVVVDDTLVVRETLSASGPVEAMWGQHATFGSDLLAGPFALNTNARRVSADALYDVAASPFLAGAESAWPHLPGKRGPVDLSRPAEGWAALAYWHGFEEDEAWAEIRRLDGALGARLSWDATLFPCAWAWFELGGTHDAPWNGQGRVIGIEPNTTRLGYGIAEAKRAGAGLLRLGAGEQVETELRLRAFGG